jgi:TonB family protein
VESFNQRQGFLISSIVHLFVMMLILNLRTSQPLETKGEPPPPIERRQAVFLPPEAVLKELVRPKAAPKPSPAPPKANDRISVGRMTGPRDRPILLHPDRDLSAVPKGQAKATAPSGSPPVAKGDGTTDTSAKTDESAGVKLPPGLGRDRAGEEGKGGDQRTERPSIASSLRRLDRDLASQGPAGLATGASHQIGAFRFDPQGADYTKWIQHLTAEVYRNWIFPQPAILGVGGRVEIRFTVQRDGSIIELTILRSSGVPALDRASANALLGGNLLKLPPDYPSPSVTFFVTFYYGDRPQGS